MELFYCHFFLLSVLELCQFGSILSYPSECVLPFPRSYVVYHLGEQETIDIDGKLDDKAWALVSWTEDFIGDWKIYVSFWLMFPSV